MAKPDSKAALFCRLTLPIRSTGNARQASTGLLLFVYGDIYIQPYPRQIMSRPFFFRLRAGLSLPLPATAVCKHSPVLHPEQFQRIISLAKAGVIKPLTGKVQYPSHETSLYLHSTHGGSFLLPGFHTRSFWLQVCISWGLPKVTGFLFCYGVKKIKTDGVLCTWYWDVIARRKKDIQYSNEVVFVNVVVSQFRNAPAPVHER